MSRLRSLRVRLAAMVFLAVAIPVVVVAVVSVRVTSDADVVIIGPGTVDVEDVETVATRLDPGAQRRVWGTVSVVLVVAAAGAWSIAGRIVRPVQRIRQTADAIEADDPGRRIGMDRGADELVALAASFDRMLDRLEVAAGAQRDFVAETSHELRTPLAVLQTNIDLLLRDPDADLDAHREAVETTQRSVARLRVLVDDLLLTARTGARRIDHDPVPVAELVSEIAAQRTAGERERLALPVIASEQVVELDVASVERAVRNLLDNALASTTGTVAVGVGLVDGWWGIGVSDRGGGLDPSLGGSIFEPYVSGSGGSGLGLAIADQVARAHGGALTVRSEPDRGATFVLWVPSSTDRSPAPTGVDRVARTHTVEVERLLTWGRHEK